MVLFLNIIYVCTERDRERERGKRERREILLYISPRRFQLKDVTHYPTLQRLSHQRLQSVADLQHTLKGTHGRDQE